jgi:integrase/recombinase XerD
MISPPESSPLDPKNTSPILNIQPDEKFGTCEVQHNRNCPCLGTAKKECGDNKAKRKRCRKQLYCNHSGKRWRESAGTRDWAVAESKRADKLASWNPTRAKANAQLAVTAIPEITIDAASAAYVLYKSKKAAQTEVKYATVRNRLMNFAKYGPAEIPGDESWKPITFLTDVNFAQLCVWRNAWPGAESTQSHFQERIKGFFKWCVRSGWLLKSPAEGLESIAFDSEQTMPIDPKPYQQVLAVVRGIRTPTRDRKSPNRSAFAAVMETLIETLRWTGLRLGDGLMLRRSDLIHDGSLWRVILPPIKTKKTNKNNAKVKQIKVVIPARIAHLLLALPSTGDERYFFFDGKHSIKNPRMTVKHLVSKWCKKVGKVSEALEAKRWKPNSSSEPMAFSAHMLRDTFAVEERLAGIPVEDVAEHLGHGSIRTTEKYYSAWVARRQKKSEDNQVAALALMGETVYDDASVQ